MTQRLIVEGNDAIVLATLCQKRRLPPPKGYETELKFKTEFVKEGGGYKGAVEAFKTSLTESALTNIGLVLDANDKGAATCWQEIRSILVDKYTSGTLKAVDAQTGFKIIAEDKMPTVGIWIMPDNKSTGYLEHFLADLVPARNELWTYADSVISDLMTKPFNVLTPTRQQKALLHTWLAWQNNPGMPFGTAIQAGYFNYNSSTVDSLLDWFSRTFQLVQ